jgi:ABC-2 type transport system ATP-binding protein
VTSDPVVEVHGVTKRYGATVALDEVDLLLGEGVVHGLVGPNGAGKSTLLSVLLGLVLEDEGTVRLLGRDRGPAGRGWLDGVAGFVEIPSFYPYLSGRRNLQLLAGLDGYGEAALVDDLLAMVLPPGAGDRAVRTYSLGMRLRLGLAAALLRRPRLLVLDEPTNGLDPGGVRDLHEALRRLRDLGVTVLLSSHDMLEVEELCDQVTVMHRGRVAFAGGVSTMRATAPDPAWRLRTSDDAAALARAEESCGVEVQHAADLVVRAGQPEMDSYVLALARAGIAVRELSQVGSPLQSLFFALTEPAPTEPAPAEAPPAVAS